MIDCIEHRLQRLCDNPERVDVLIEELINSALVLDVSADYLAKSLLDICSPSLDDLRARGKELQRFVCKELEED